MKATIYHNPRCSKSRETLAILQGTPGVEVEIVLGGVRYREKGPELKVTTGADGVFEVSWPEAGLWWLEATVQGADASGARKSSGYVATLEVLPD